MSSIKFSQLQTLANPPGDTIFPVVSSGTNYQISLNTIRLATIPSWSSVTGKPTFATVAFSGLWQDIANKPTIPTIPTNVSYFANDSQYVTQSAFTWNNLSSKPGFAAIASSGNWSDVVNKPAWLNSNTVGVLYNNNGTIGWTTATLGGGGISTATVTALIANSLTNYTATPFKLTSSTQVVSLASNGILTLPNNSTIVTDGSDGTYMTAPDTGYVGMNADASWVYVESDGAYLEASNGTLPRIWWFDKSGTINIPNLPPTITFTAILVPVRHSGDPGAFAWTYDVHFVVGQDGSIETQIDNSLVRYDNPGYQSGDSYTFTEADHGISGYSFTITLNNVTHGDAGWTANLAVSPPPAYPSTVHSNGAIKLSANDKNFVLASNGTTTFPNGLQVTSEPYNSAVIVTSGSTHGLSLRSGVHGDNANAYVNLAPNGVVIDFDGDNPGPWVFRPDGSLQFPDGSKQVTAGGLIQSATAPETTSTSTLWYDTVGGRSYVYFDNSWVDASPVSTASATTSSLVNGSYHFTLGVDGTINFDPATNGKGVLQTTADIWFNANGAIYNFGATGDLTLAGGNVFFSGAPDSTVMYNSGISVSSSTAYGISTGGVSGSNNLYWFEKPGNAATGLWNAIRLNSAEDAASTGSIVISTGQFVSRKNWIYAQDGTLTLPGNLIGDNLSIQGAPVTITITDTGGVWGGAPGTYTRLNGITPPKWAPANYNPSSDSSITYNGGWQLNNPNFGHPVYVNTGTLSNPSATWNPDVQFGLGSGNPAGTYSYNNWTFGSDATLKVPGTIYAQASDNGSIVFSNDGSTDHGSLKVDGGYNMVINSESNYYVKRNGQDRLGITDTDTTLMAGRNLVLKSNKNSTEQVWSFNSTGSLTFPDTTVQTTAFTGTIAYSNVTGMPSDIDGYTTTATVTALIANSLTNYVPSNVVSPPVTSAGAVGDKAGQLAYDAGYQYYCVADYTTTNHSIVFNSINYVTTPSNSASTIANSAGTFTVEVWVKISDITNSFYIVGGAGWAIGKGAFANGNQRFFYSNSSHTWYSNENTGSPSSSGYNNTWVHFAVCVSSGTPVGMFVNGWPMTPNIDVTQGDIQSGINYLTIGSVVGNGYGAGSISDLRIIKGSVLYTSSFTPPVKGLTAITNTSLLLSTRSSTIVDSSTNTFVLSLSGTPTVSTTNPYANIWRRTAWPTNTW